jgi:hypothetical protein
LSAWAVRVMREIGRPRPDGAVKPGAYSNTVDGLPSPTLRSSAVVQRGHRRCSSPARRRALPWPWRAPGACALPWHGAAKAQEIRV